MCNLNDRDPFRHADIRQPDQIPFKVQEARQAIGHPESLFIADSFTLCAFGNLIICVSCNCRLCKRTLSFKTFLVSLVLLHLQTPTWSTAPTPSDQHKSTDSFQQSLTLLFNLFGSTFESTLNPFQPSVGLHPVLLKLHFSLVVALVTSSSSSASLRFRIIRSTCSTS